MSDTTDAADATEECFDEFEHYNYDQDKAMMSGHSGKCELCLGSSDFNLFNF